MKTEQNWRLEKEDRALQVGADASYWEGLAGKVSCGLNLLCEGV